MIRLMYSKRARRFASFADAHLQFADRRFKYFQRGMSERFTIKGKRNSSVQTGPNL